MSFAPRPAFPAAGGRFIVNNFGKQIHRHFGVQSRGELLARWVKRQWGAKCAWADDPPR